LRYIQWLNQNPVLQHVQHLNAAKTLYCFDETLFGAERPRNHATSQNALTQCVLNVACSLEAYAAKPLNGKPLKKMSMTTSTMTRLGLKEKHCVNSEPKTFTRMIKLETKVTRANTSFFQFILIEHVLQRAV